MTGSCAAAMAICSQQIGFHQGLKEQLILQKKLWKIENPDKIAQHQRFGKIMRARKNKDGKQYWWSKDKAGHGNSAWKVFEEKKDGLHWEMDADKFGNRINKQKGPIGRFIPWKELGIIK